MRLLYHRLITGLLVAIAILGGMLLMVGILKPVPRQIANPFIFVAPGIMLLTLCGLGFYYGVLSYWLGCVRFFRWDGRHLAYRTVFSRTIQLRSADEVQQVFAKRPDSSQEDAGTWRLIRFRDGTRIKLQLGILHNADGLYRALQAEVLKRAPQLPALPEVPQSHPRWSAIEPYLDEGEEA